MFALQISSLVFLAFAFIAIWSPKKIGGLAIWCYPFAISVALGFGCNAISVLGLLWIGIALSGFYTLNRWRQYTHWIVVPLAIYCLALGMNLLSGFTPIRLFEPQLLGNSLHPFGLEFKFAKPIVGLLVLAFIAQHCVGWREVGGLLLPLYKWIIPTLAVLAIGVVLGLSVDIKILWWTPVFIICNLFFSVIPEEAFFRGFIQQPLHNKFDKAVWIVPIVAVLFALVHMPPDHIDPLKFYALIGLAGVCYAWVYQLKQRIELSIAAHCLLNSTHFLFFTYPLSF